jgi:hypothetical protein
MARTVCEKTYNRDRLAKKKLALKQLRLLDSKKAEEELAKGVNEIYGHEYELEFKDVVSNMVNLNKNIDSVNQLKGIARNVGTKSVSGATIDVNSDHEGDVYTSKHFVYGTLIVTCWREFIRIKDLEQRQLEQEPDVQISGQHDSQNSLGGRTSGLKYGAAIKTQVSVEKEKANLLKSHDSAEL